IPNWGRRSSLRNPWTPETWSQPPGRSWRRSTTSLRQAFEQRASDIHLEPKRDRAVVRFRVDGVLRTMHTFPRIVYQAVVSRLKMLSGLDIAEKRRPQDGRFKRIEPDKEIELRVSTLPTIFGEKAVLRVFDPAALVSSLEQLRLTEDDETRLRQMLGRREGLVLVTGPTGSGKTTTLYSVLRHLATPEVNVVTIEDPVELIYPPLSQVQVNPRIRLTFAATIRSVLRQDPDIVMVGEIRDRETAEMAVQAALTGHLVLSTLHTNDAPGAITRLADLGVPRFLIGTTLVGVVAQRLVRTICSGCTRETRVSAEGRGCARCRDTGYRGRRGIFEILTIDSEAAADILGGCTAEDLARSARRRGIPDLRQAAVGRLLEGDTTVAEVIRVTGVGQIPRSAAAPPRGAAADRRGDERSVAQGAADHEEQRRDPVERNDHVTDRRGLVRHRDLREAARTRQRDLPDPGNRVDEQNPGQVEEEVHHRQLESPVGIGAGNRESCQEGGECRSDVGAQGDRESVIKEQEPRPGEGDQHRGGYRTGLDQNRDDRSHTHGRKRVAAEHPVNDGLAPTRGKALQGANQQSEGHHQEHHRDDGQDGGSRLIRTGDDAGEPLDRPRNQLNDTLERALVVDSAAQCPSEDLRHHPDRRARKPVAISSGSRMPTAIRLNKSWQVATAKARRSSWPALRCPRAAIVFVTVVPTLAPITMGMALSNGNGDPGAATKPTMRELVTEELCTRVVARIPMRRPTRGFAEARKKLSRSPDPRPSKPAPEAVNRSQKEDEEQNQADESGDLAESGDPAGHAPTGFAARHPRLPRAVYTESGHGSERQRQEDRREERPTPEDWEGG
ncbi:Type IV pilus assembly ATPase PilB, partial [Geodia barretti]